MTEVIIYKLHKNFNIKLSDSDKYKVTGTIVEITTKLKENKGYCLKLYEDKPCIVYVDLDHCPDETIFSKFCDLLSVKFDVSLNEISYTLSKKENEFSYHISIPSIESTPKYLKQVFAMACFDEYINNKTLDLNVYSNNRWFRLPFQTNDEKPLAHIIIKGKMEDFIVNYVEDADVVLAEDEDSVVVSSVITEKESKVELNDGLDIQDFISELLDILDSDRADDWEKWRNIGFIVHSELGNSGFDMFDTFSQQSNKYNKSKVKKFWESIKDNTYKPMTVKSLMACAKKDNIKEYNNIKKEYVKISNTSTTTVTGVYNDLQAAQVVYSLYKHFVCCDSVLYCFDDSTGLWTDKEEILFSIISRFNDNLYLLTKDKDGNIKKGNKGYGNSTVLQRQMLPQLKTLCINNDWTTQTQFSSIGKLLYLNGFLDMKTGTFYYHFDPTIVFIYKIYQFYDLNTLDKNYLEDIKQRYFYNQLGEEVGNYLILNVARGLAGDRMKKIFFGLGDTNAGKSTIVNACKAAFGDYTGTFNAENFSNRNSSNDEAQLMRWALLLRYKRLIFSNEMKSSSELSGNMMKKVSSGGDELIGRTHGKEETSFVPHFLCFCMANDIPKIAPFDNAINNRLNIISYNKRFVAEPSNEFELKLDENLDNEMKSDKFKIHFGYLITNAYYKYIENNKIEVIPDGVKNAKTEWVGDDADNLTINKFLEDYEITNDIVDYTTNKDIEEWLKNNKITISITKFVMELKKYCSIMKYNNIESKVKKIAGKCYKGWVGIKLIDNCDENQLDL